MQGVEVDPTSPLMWVIREKCALTDTKFGSGVAQCGACRFIFLHLTFLF
jgi:isoquinoline 1-oxidoreductase alpha subunit